MPRAIIIAGPNGAGKTTFATEYLPNEGNCIRYVNADLIAAGLSPFDPDLAAVAAGRLLLELIDEYAAAGDDFVFETTLSGHTYARRIQAWRASGYNVRLVLLWLPSVELAVRRVRRRVAQGGHNVPEHVIRRRFAAGLANLDQIYKPLVNEWRMYDNSGMAPQRINSGSQPVMRKGPEQPDEVGSGIEAALLRAARRARVNARQTGTPLVIWRDGQVCEVDPNDASDESDGSSGGSPRCRK